MPSFMFIGHDKCACYIAREHLFSGFEIAIEVPQALLDIVAETYDSIYGRPVFVFLRNL
jgi:hypothetical protein